MTEMAFEVELPEFDVVVTAPEASVTVTESTVAVIAVEGDVGPQGPEGPQGADSTVPGPTGPQGEQGEVGTEILAGPDEPRPFDGRQGDYYTDTTTHIMYGPKASDEPETLPAETIITQVPTGGFFGPLRIGNRYLPSVDGQILSGRFWRSNSMGSNLIHRVYLYDDAHALVATTVASVGETAGLNDWVTVDFPTPAPVTAGEEFTVVIDAEFYAYRPTHTEYDPSHVTFVSSQFGIFGSSVWPNNVDTSNYFVDVVWEPVVTAEIWPVAVTGAQGEPGPTGPTGPTGPAGPGSPFLIITAAAYAALTPKDPATLYVISG